MPSNQMKSNQILKNNSTHVLNRKTKIYSLHDQSETRSLSDSLDNIPSSVFGPEGIVTRFTLPLSYGRKEARQKRQGYAKTMQFYFNFITFKSKHFATILIVHLCHPKLFSWFSSCFYWQSLGILMPTPVDGISKRLLVRRVSLFLVF